MDIDPRALSRLNEYDWPGNVRELRNVIARAAVLAQGSRIAEDDLPEPIRATRVLTTSSQALAEPAEGEKLKSTFERRLRKWRRAQ